MQCLTATYGTVPARGMPIVPWIVYLRPNGRSWSEGHAHFALIELDGVPMVEQAYFSPVEQALPGYPNVARSLEPAAPGNITFLKAAYP